MNPDKWLATASGFDSRGVGSTPDEARENLLLLCKGQVPPTRIDIWSFNSTMEMGWTSHKPKTMRRGEE